MKFFKIQKNNQNSKGFTIIETLVAISILLVSTTGPLAFSQNGLKASFLARDQIVAFYLAQDVIETIKNIRDNTALNGSTDWLSGLGDCQPGDIGTSVKCNLDTMTYNTQSCSGAQCNPLWFDSSTKQFTFNSGSDSTLSKFTRTIFVTEIQQDKEAQIVVEIAWVSNFQAQKRIIVQENMYNWVPSYAP